MLLCDFKSQISLYLGRWYVAFLKVVIGSLSGHSAAAATATTTTTTTTIIIIIIIFVEVVVAVAVVVGVEETAVVVVIVIIMLIVVRLNKEHERWKRSLQKSMNEKDRRIVEMQQQKDRYISQVSSYLYPFILLCFRCMGR